MRDYTNRRVTRPKRVTSLTSGPPPTCKQSLKTVYTQTVHGRTSPAT